MWLELSVQVLKERVTVFKWNEQRSPSKSVQKFVPDLDALCGYHAVQHNFQSALYHTRGHAVV
jgi:hypothetical protein